jgi:2-dehydropantoate 2-reductase
MRSSTPSSTASSGTLGGARLRYLVFGTGAVGGYVGGRLALSGQEVVFLSRPSVAEALLRDGLHITGDDPGGIVTQPQVIKSMRRAFSPIPPEIVLLCVKAYDCQLAADELRDFAHLPFAVVCLLNGIGNEETLAERLAEERVIPASLTTAVRMLLPGLVQVDRRRGLALAGCHPRIPYLVEEFHRAGIQTVHYRDPKRMKWSKILTNIVANPTAAIVGWPPSRVFRDRGLYRLEIEALREVVRLMRHMGMWPQNLPRVPLALLARAIFLPPFLVQPLLHRAVASGRGQKPPSFLTDIERGRSEIQWLSGAVARQAMQMGLPASANHLLYEVFSALVTGRMDPQAFRGHPERLLALAEEAGVPGIRGYNQSRTADSR